MPLRHSCRYITSVAPLLLLTAFVSTAHGDTVFVKYRGPADLAPFRCETVARSSLVRRVCYDAHERYKLISLNGTYYHYCD
jgi:hypothetical protein